MHLPPPLARPHQLRVPSSARGSRRPSTSGYTASSSRRGSVVSQQRTSPTGLDARRKSFVASGGVLEQAIAMRRKLLGDDGGAGAQAAFTRECRIGLRSAIPDMVDYLTNSIDFEDEEDIKREITMGLEEMVDKTIRAGWATAKEDLERLDHLEKKTAGLEKHLAESQKAYLVEVVEMRQQLRRNSMMVDDEHIHIKPDEVAKMWFDPINHGLDYPDQRPKRPITEEMKEVRDGTTQSLKDLVRLMVEERLRIILSDPSLIVKKLKQMGNLSALIALLTADDDSVGYEEDLWRLGLRPGMGERYNECKGVQTDSIEETVEKPSRGQPRRSEVDMSVYIERSEHESAVRAAECKLQRELKRIELQLEEARKEASEHKQEVEASKVEVKAVGGQLVVAKGRISELEKALVAGEARTADAVAAAVASAQAKMAKAEAEAASAKDKWDKFSMPVKLGQSRRQRRSLEKSEEAQRLMKENNALEEELARLRQRLMVVEERNAVMETEILSNRPCRTDPGDAPIKEDKASAALPELGKRGKRRPPRQLVVNPPDAASREMDWRKVWLRLYLDAFRRTKDLDSLRAKHLLLNVDKFLEMLRSQKEDAFDGHFDLPGEVEDSTLSSSFEPFRSSWSDLWTIDSWFESRQSTRANKSRSSSRPASRWPSESLHSQSSLDESTQFIVTNSRSTPDIICTRAQTAGDLPNPCTPAAASMAYRRGQTFGGFI